MAISTPQSGKQSNISSERDSGFNIRTTLPDELLRHNISDEELTMMSDSKRDNIWEGMWVAIGSTIGFLPSGVSILFAFSSDESYRMTGLELAQVILFFMSLISAGILVAISKNKLKDIRDLVTAIRERTKCLQESTQA